jgi:hypothetical protein
VLRASKIMETVNKKQNFKFILCGRFVNVRCTQKELTEYKTKIINKCKELKPLEGFDGIID